MPITAVNFETILPLIGAIFSFSFGVFVWLKSPKTDVNILFLAFCIAITYWLFGTFEMFLHRDNVEAAIFWDRFVYLGVVFVPSIMHHFSLAITGNKGQRGLLWTSYAFSFIFLIVSRTRYFVDGLNVFPSLVHSRAQIGHHIFLVLFFFYASIMFVNFYRHYKKKSDSRTRNVLLLSSAAFLNILIIGGTAYLPAYGIDIGYPFSYFSGIFFVILLSVAVTEYQALSSRIIVAEMSTFLVSLIFAANIVLSQSVGQAAFFVVSLAVFVYYGSETVRAMNEEIKRRKELQDLTLQLREANEHLKETDKLKSEFISIASHQLRTPISVIKGYVALMLEGAYGPISGPLREKMESMNMMNERLVQMINNMLNVSRIEKNRIDYSCATLDVTPILRGIAEELAYKARQKSIAIEVDAPNALMAFIDGEKVQEVLSNLIDNAIKYSVSGTIRVSARRRAKEKDILVSVADQGIGMSVDAAAHVFQKFYRANDPAVTREPGTGLGLYICGIFLRGMGGDIWVEKTAPGKGTEIAFLLPTKPSQQCVMKPKKRPRASGDAA